MTSVRKLSPLDLFTFNLVNLDRFTETYYLSFYAHYFTKWPTLQRAVVASDGSVVAYLLAKAEGSGEQRHGHVSAVTVAPEYRRIGLARRLMDFLELITDREVRGYFVDLFVRTSNVAAMEMYRRLGYDVYRTVVGYYSDAEDAYDMRKPMPSQDPHGGSLRCAPHKRRIRPEELAFD
ncbi:hypothetical protein CDCA_CDCA08G2443 [Cyanidium caldarium]|uniref:N-acetyltransferase domain-containing protein n=1 Tax=Cyanidium caldarium TaxID=2771 RepID=A0AAV9IX89_CYACA|nr:hypothetical protein CDCA_CDCA08G2443 [Cyanidium caldarium]